MHARRGLRAVRCLFSVVLLCSSVALAQVRESIEVAVTNLDVIVTDASGKPVHGLTPADLEVYEGRSRREISNLMELAAEDDAPITAQAPPRGVLILLDNTTLTLRNRRYAAEAVKRWLASLRSGDQVAVTTAIPSLQLKLPWTTDKAAAVAAVETAAGETTSRSEEERRATEEKVQNVLNHAATAGANEQVKFDDAMQAARVYAESVSREANQTMAAIAAALGYFPPRGHKNVLLIIGEGLPLHPGSEMFEHLNSIKMDLESGMGPARLRAGAREASPLADATSYDLTPVLQKIAALANRGGVMVYAVNPGDNQNVAGQVMANGPRDTRADFARSAANRAGYEMLVQKTGGTAFYAMPPELALAQISAELQTYYSIGYRPAAGSDAPLTVRSARGYRVRFTRAALPQSPEEMMREAVLAHHVSRPLTNDLAIALAADPPVADGDRRKVHLQVLIPVGKLQLDPDGEDVVGKFSVYVSSGDEKGRATNVNRQSHDLRFPAAAVTGLKGKTIAFAVDVAVPQTLTQISVGVIDDLSQQTGFERVRIRD